MQNFTKIHPFGTVLIHADRHMERRLDWWKEMTAILGAFRKFAVEPKNEIKLFKHKLLFKGIKYLCKSIKKKVWRHKSRRRISHSEI